MLSIQHIFSSYFIKNGSSVEGVSLLVVRNLVFIDDVINLDKRRWARPQFINYYTSQPHSQSRSHKCLFHHCWLSALIDTTWTSCYIVIKEGSGTPCAVQLIVRLVREQSKETSNSTNLRWLILYWWSFCWPFASQVAMEKLFFIQVR